MPEPRMAVEEKVRPEKDYSDVKDIEAEKDFVIPGMADAIEEEDIMPKAHADLSEYITQAFEEAEDHRRDEDIDDRLEASMRQYKGEYDEETQSTINEQGGADVFRKLTMMKSDTLAAWISDFLGNEAERMWKLKPTTKPNLPMEEQARIIQKTQRKVMEMMAPLQQLAQQAGPQGMAEFAGEMEEIAYDMAKSMREDTIEDLDESAQESMKGMTREVSDQLIEGKWHKTFAEFVTNFSIYQNAFIRGPMVGREQRLTWGKDNEAIVSEEPIIQFKNVSPFDIYPSPNSEGIDDGYLIEKVKISRSELASLSKLEGYDEDNIEKVLDEDIAETSTRFSAEEQTRAELENKADVTEKKLDKKLEALYFWGPLKGKMLKEWGHKDKELEDGNEYEAFAIKVGEEVIYARLNSHPLGKRPYSMASFKPIPNAFWGMSLPEVMEDVQRECNFSVRALCNNMTIGSGPSIAYDVAQLPPGHKLKRARPFQIHQFDSRKSPNARYNPIQYLEANMKTGELLGAYSSFKKEGDEVTGVPLYAQGASQKGGAAGTASGLAMLQSNATRGIKRIILRIGMNVICDVVKKLYVWNMLYNDDGAIKGDAQVQVRGPLAMVAKEFLQQRRTEFLNMTNNPVDLKLTGKANRANLLREIARTLELDDEDLVKTEEQIEKEAQMEREMQMQQMQAQREEQLRQEQREEQARADENQLKQEEIRTKNAGTQPERD